MSARRALLTAVALLGCAQYGAPPGGERDQRPPQVIETVPAPLAVVPDLRGEVRIRFDERLSERGAEDAVLVSPRTGAVDVKRDGNELRVSLEGGWRPGQIYRIVILPELRDLFGNQRTEPADLVFSTGPPVPQTALAGMLTERITGRPPQRAVVEAVRTADSTVYVTPVATDGFYALLNLPNGDYVVTGFTDGNQNWSLDANEPRSGTATLTLADDTLALDLAVLPIDTVAARVLSAAMQDSVVRVQLDDYVDSTGIAGASARLYALPDTALVPIALALRTPAQHDRRTRPDPAVAPDSIVRPDSVARPDSVGAPARRPAPAADAAPTAVLPTREIVIVPARRPAPGEYLLWLQDVVNINGIPGGGGWTTLRVAVPDTVAAPPADTTQPPADTTQPPAAMPPPTDAVRVPSPVVRARRR